MSVSATLFLVVWIIFTILLPLRFKERGLHDAQMVSTGLGILGTFVGIVFGLYHFDVTNIEKAVPELLIGLKFAFVTSIVGMGWSLTMSTFSDYWGFKNAENDPRSEAYILGEMLKEMRALREGMAGQDSDSVVTQLQKMRGDQNDNHKEIRQYHIEADANQKVMLETMSAILEKQASLVSSFEHFAEVMAENNTKALIEAIQEVMDRFSHVINDKLENTFVELKEAAQTLVVWQREHKDELSSATDALTSARTAMEVSVQMLAEISTRAKEFDTTARELKAAVDTLGSGMAGIKSLADEMQGSGEKIQKSMEEVTKKSIQTLGENLLGVSEKLVEDIQRLQRIITEIHREHTSQN